MNRNLYLGQFYCNIIKSLKSILELCLKNLDPYLVEKFQRESLITGNGRIFLRLDMKKLQDRTIFFIYFTRYMQDY